MFPSSGNLANPLRLSSVLWLRTSTAEDAKFDKTLMTDLLRQACHPMIVTLADAAYCYNRVNHMITSLVWLVLTNGNFPAIVTALICLQTMIFFRGRVLENPRHFLEACYISPT
jgi:hypothetical protein